MASLDLFGRPLPAVRPRLEPVRVVQPWLLDCDSRDLPGQRTIGDLEHDQTEQAQPITNAPGADALGAICKD